MMSAMVTSGVASFSTYRCSRPTHAMGVSSPPSSISCRAYLEIGANGLSLISLPATIGNRVVEERDERAEDARLRLTAQAEEDEVVPGEEGVDDLRHDGLLVADHALEQRSARASRARRFSRSSSLTERLARAA